MNFVRRFIFRKEPKNIIRTVRLEGMISAGTGAKNINLEKLEKQLDRAFDTKKVTPIAVCLEINSPGGSAVQSALIHNRIRRLSKKTNIPVLAFVEDYAASGGYMLAISAQEIFINEFSAVGSIGALMASFGLVKTIEKLGMERRVVHAGKNKLRLDPFQPEKPEDVQWAQEKLVIIHNNFIKMVTSRRLQIVADNKKGVFEAEVFFGQEAIDVGLADKMYTDKNEILIKRFGDCKFEKLKAEKPLTQKILEKFGTSTSAGLDVDEVLDSVEQRYFESKLK